MKALLVRAAFAGVFVLGFGLRGQSQQDAPREHSMTGCLQKGTDADAFQLTDLERGPKTVEIAESAVNLAPHVGHKIEITGTAVTGKDPQAHTMKVTAMKMVARECP
ncbi:MAG: hypothetical protein HY648_13780 [Acidobacteria bacterium]|nr:hypothetical protein [Acidobacteriota bacterium]